MYTYVYMYVHTYIHTYISTSAKEDADSETRQIEAAIKETETRLWGGYD